MNIGKSIRLIRKELKISQNEFALKTNLSQTSLSQIENGVKKPSPSTLKRIAGILGMPEALLYIIAIQEEDISDQKRIVYRIIQPAILKLCIQLILSPAEPHLHILSGAQPVPGNDDQRPISNAGRKGICG